jgi:hypothetical protein
MTSAKACAYALAMTKPQQARVLRRFERAGRAGWPPEKAFILAVLQERAAIYSNLPPPRDPSTAPQPYL